MILAGITPDQGMFMLKSAVLLVELSSCAVALWMYSRRYNIRSLVLKARRHL